MLLMFWSRLAPSCMLCIIWDHCEVICYFDYIKLLFYQFLITVTLFEHPLWYHFQKPLERLHSRFLQVLASNSFIKLTLSECCCFHSAVLVFEVLHHLCLGYLRNWFVYAETYTGHGGQNKHCLFVPQINTLIGKMDFSITELWFGTVYFPFYLQVMSYIILNLYIKVVC